MNETVSENSYRYQYLVYCRDLISQILKVLILLSSFKVIETSTSREVVQRNLQEEKFWVNFTNFIIFLVLFTKWNSIEWLTISLKYSSTEKIWRFHFISLTSNYSGTPQLFVECRIRPLQLLLCFRKTFKDGMIIRRFNTQ